MAAQERNPDYIRTMGETGCGESPLVFLVVIIVVAWISEHKFPPMSCTVVDAVKKVWPLYGERS